MLQLLRLSGLTNSCGPNLLSHSLRSARLVQLQLVSCASIKPNRTTSGWLPHNTGRHFSLSSSDMGNKSSRVKSYSPNKAENPGMAAKPANSASSSSSQTHSPSTDNIDKQSIYVEAVVCKDSDIQENEKKVFSLAGEGEVLIIKQEGQIYALGTKCTHYGAPLEKGALDTGRIRCQWHGACFNIRSGNIEDFPGLDSLPSYEVKVVDNNIRVRASLTQLKANRRIKPFEVKRTSDTRTFIVVGGGAAGNMCVQTLRENGYTGQIVFIIGEKYLPYDRVKLSKALNSDVESITLRNITFFRERNIDTVTGVQLARLDAEKKEITLNNAETLKYDKLFLATGASARRLPGPGTDLKNIFTLRTVTDANAISSTLTPQTEVVILGASFIGLEVASAVLDKVKSVTVVAMEDVPFGPILGTDVGKRIWELFEEKGVKFAMEQSIVEYRGTDGVLSSVVLKDGRELKADICLMGVGAVANTKFLADIGVELQRDGSVEVDDYLHTGLEDVYAGGDIAYAPVLGSKAAIGHWQLAHYHGYIAALNMAGQETKINAVPYFWTMLFGKGFRYAGYAPKFARTEVRGSIETFSFIVFYIMESENVGAVLTCGRDPVASQFANILHRGERLLASDIDVWLNKYI